MERGAAPSRVTGMPYEVHTPVFDGPFDMLLHLILREQVDLYEINLSEIVDAYLAELDRMDRLDLEVATEFLLIAATLVELKARRLLPDDNEVDLDDELGLWEERDLLLARLVECKTFKDAALVLRKLSAHAARSYPRRVGPVEDRFIGLAPDLLERTTPEDLRAAYITATAPKPVIRVDISHITPIKVTVAEAVEELVDELPRVGRLTFRELTSELVDRIEVVVRFLAVLELFKQGVVELDQPGNFGEIAIVWIGDESVRAEAITIDTYEG
ncbi:MAG: segregation/condensation protein A [Acidimicrobiales bacterium]|nr:MAG: segregation/condensation protein A [Acidimicrobiales bacterium]